MLLLNKYPKNSSWLQEKDFAFSEIEQDWFGKGSSYAH